MKKITHQYKLANPYIFWFIIIALLLITFGASQYFSSNSGTNTMEVTKADSTIVEKSYKQNQTPIEIDLDNMTHMDYENYINIEKSRSILPNFIHDNLNMFLLILYTVALALLFVYREKQNRLQRQYMEQFIDEIKIKNAQKEFKTNSFSFESVKDEIEKQQTILSPYFASNTIEEHLSEYPDYVMMKARIVLEKVITQIYYNKFETKTTLNQMIVALHRKNILQKDIDNYAHTIKGFGNQAAHYHHRGYDATTQDALLTISTLIKFIELVQSRKLLEKTNV